MLHSYKNFACEICYPWNKLHRNRPTVEKLLFQKVSPIFACMVLNTHVVLSNYVMPWALWSTFTQLLYLISIHNTIYIEIRNKFTDTKGNYLFLQDLSKCLWMNFYKLLLSMNQIFSFRGNLKMDLVPEIYNRLKQEWW